MKRVATITLSLALAQALTFAVAQQSPPPSPLTASKEKQEAGRDKSSPPKKENSPTPTPESTATQPNPTPTAQNSETASSKSRKESSFDYNALAVTVFTAALAFLAWRQTKAMNKQAEYMRDGLEENKMAAKAAKDSADAANKAVALSERNTTVTGRAVVLIEKVQGLPIPPPTDQDYFKYNSLIAVTLKNYGSTLAKNVRLTGELKHPGGSFNFREMPETTIAPQGVNEWITLSLQPSGLTPEHIEVINSMNNVFTFSIRVTYNDVFDNPYVYEASGLFIPLLRRFIISATS